MSFLNKRIQFIKPRKNGRRPSNWPQDSTGLPLRITKMLPKGMAEKTATFDKEKKESDIVCIAEMMSLFDCFEKHEFDHVQCSEQAKALEKCYSNYCDRKALARSKKTQIK